MQLEQAQARELDLVRALELELVMDSAKEQELARESGQQMDCLSVLGLEILLGLQSEQVPVDCKAILSKLDMRQSCILFLWQLRHIFAVVNTKPFHMICNAHQLQNN